MKNSVFYFLLICFCVALTTSCEKEVTNPGVDPDPDPEEEVKKETEKDYPFSLIVSEKNIPLFKETKLSIDGSPGLLLFYDSIKWSIPEKVTWISAQNDFLMSVNHCFHIPGNYQAILEGYKDGKVIRSDEIIIQAYMAGDFLGIEWNTAVSTQPSLLSCIIENSFLNLEYVSSDTPYALLSHHSDSRLEEEEWIEFQTANQTVLYEYITEVYGEPAFHYQGDDIHLTDLRDVYDERFKNGLNNTIPYSEYVPVAIWETGTTNMALIGSIKSGIETDIHYFMIIAEPK